MRSDLALREIAHEDQPRQHHVRALRLKGRDRFRKTIFVCTGS